MWEEINNKLEQIYTRDEAEHLVGELKKLKITGSGKRKREITEKDAALITYADSVSDKTGIIKTLSVLEKFLTENKLFQVLPIVHILPFYPWDTDRGFSVKNFYEVSEQYGDWNDIKKLTETIDLMFDFVANHASIDNPMVQGALIARHTKKNEFAEFVLAYDENDKPAESDLLSLIRPRPTPVLSKYTVIEENGEYKAILGSTTPEATKNLKLIGSGYVWTTFSRPENEDGSTATRQVDLNFKNPQVLITAVKVMLFYVLQGAKLIRLDAIGYLWKKMQSTSLHEPEVHLILQILTEIFSILSPQTVMIAEVNEPQEKILGYLGNETAPEADLVYQFTHFPLAIHGLMTGSGKYYTDWLKSTKDFKGRQFVTVLGSHDGLGLKPVRGILPDAEIEKLSKHLVDDLGGLPNFALLPGGAKNHL